MVTTEALPVVVDAGPIIHLDELGCLDLLSDLSPAIVPQVVWAEVSLHRRSLKIGMLGGVEQVSVHGSISDRIKQLNDEFELGAGEVSALVYMSQRACRFLLTDDAAARLAAEQMGWRAHGTIGVIVRSIRRGLRSREQVCDILSGIRQRSSLHIAQAVLNTAISKVMTSGD
jgi:predicted nucleic acid-binding protein